MNNNESTQMPEERHDEESKQVANMDQYDFMMMLMESRIIQAS